MKKVFVFALLFVGLPALAQDASKRNSLYPEAGGAGLFGSLSFERQLTRQPGLGMRVGVGFYTENAFYLTIPVGLNYLFPLTERSFIDAGMNVTWARKDARVFNGKGSPDPDNFTSFVPTIGFRKHTARNLMWRVSLNPVINNKAFTPWLGVALGKRF